MPSNCLQCGCPLPSETAGPLCLKCAANQHATVSLPHASVPHASVPHAEPGKASTRKEPQSLADTTDLAPGTPPFIGHSPAIGPLVGQRFGNYLILAELGRGGMGVVYEAVQLDNERRVALKVLQSPLDSSTSIKRFLREGRLAAAINHPNSVYVFGTEEIQGVPAIAMELIEGGTLQDRVNREGPMPITAAVDAILQLIGGLEAACHANILHRDIKPSNCFVELDGSVRIGDFGLSISTSSDVSNITQPGTLLGTPKYASPEQLRGTELSVHSDIYSVGATLYYLLLGRAPYEANNMVHLVAAVLEQTVPSPGAIRPEIPPALSAIMLRCLEKQPSKRFRNYADLRQSLLPYSSHQSSPAPLGRRIVAYLIDCFILSIVVMAVSAGTFGLLADFADVRRDAGQLGAMAFVLLHPILAIAYFGLLDGKWGRTLGKTICGLRVVGPAGGAPGIPRAALRAAIVYILYGAPVWLCTLLFHQHPNISFWSDVALTVDWGLLAASFLTARQNNGYAPLHDLVLICRVQTRQVQFARLALPTNQVPLSTSEDLGTIGPYRIVRSLGRGSDEEIFLAHDPQLQRDVWIRTLPKESPAVDATRRNLRRVGRLRWLTGRRSQTENWDAFEAPTGQPFLTLVERANSWNVTRFWLLDLAEELAAIAQNQEPPVVRLLDRVWISGDGRAKLLDFPAAGYHSKQSVEPTNTLGDGPFLQQVAAAALNGIHCLHRTRAPFPANSNPANPVPTTPVPANPILTSPLPLAARSFLLSLARNAECESSSPTPGAEPANLQEIVSTLRNLVQQAPEISRARRVWGVVTCCLPLIMLLPFIVIVTLTLNYRYLTHPDLYPLERYLAALHDLKARAPQGKGYVQPLAGTPEEIENVKRFVAHRFQRLLQDPVVQESLSSEEMTIEFQGLLAEKIDKQPPLTDAELADIRARLKPFIDQVDREAVNEFPWIFVGGLSVLVSLAVLLPWLFLLATASLLTASFGRGEVLPWLFGVALVTRTGEPIRSWHAIARSLVVWSPTWLALAVILVTVGWLSSSLVETSSDFPKVLLFVLVGVGVYFLLAIISALIPQRGIADRIVGTWLVPR